MGVEPSGGSGRFCEEQARARSGSDSARRRGDGVEAYGSIGAARSDLKEGRNASCVGVKGLVELDGGLNAEERKVSDADLLPRVTSVVRTALMTCVSGAIVCSRVAKSDWVNCCCSPSEPKGQLLASHLGQDTAAAGSRTYVCHGSSRGTALAAAQAGLGAVRDSEERAQSRRAETHSDAEARELGTCSAPPPAATHEPRYRQKVCALFSR